MPELTDNILGIDPGLETLVTTSDGQIFENPHFHKKEAKKLKRLNRRISRRPKKGGSNREKAKLQKAKLERTVARKRKNYINKMTTDLVKTKPNLVVYEGSNVPNMVKNHHVASAIQDAAFGMIGEQLEYKCRRAGIRFLRSNQWYPSSKCCSSCGFHKKNLKWKDRVFKCPSCGLEIDRDLNAAFNMQFYGKIWLEIESTGGVSGINAQGDKRLQCIIRAYAQFLADEARKKAKASRKHSAYPRTENPTLSSSSKIRTVL